MTNEDKSQIIELAIQYKLTNILDNCILQTNYTVEDCIVLGFERVKLECHNHEQCTSKCKFYGENGCYFQLCPEYWNCEQIKKEVIT